MSTRITRTGILLIAAVIITACSPKKEAPSFYVEPTAEQEKAKLVKGEAYRGKDGKLYMPVKTGQAAPKPAAGQAENKKNGKPFQAVDGKNYYFVDKAHSELGIKSTAKTSVAKKNPVKPAGLTPEQRAQVIAEVDGEKITVGELFDKINSRPPAWRRMFATNDKKEAFLENNIINEILLYKAASKAGLDKDPTVDEARKKRMVDILRREKFSELKKNIKVEEADLKKFYDENIAQFKQPEGIIGAHILVKTEKEAQDIYKQLVEIEKKNDPKKGKIWRELVKKHSLDLASKDKGGLLGDKKTRVIIKDDKNHDKAIVDGVWAIKENGFVGAPVKTAKGWHVLKRYNKRKALNIDYGMAKKRLRRLVERQKVTEAFTKWMEGLRKKYNAKIIEENFKLVTVNLEIPKKETEAVAAPADNKEKK
ncbi:MAG: peptidylprolyl isomerase [Deltaproteobacteria bacterium]|nr:peptidylprolyl isomerase [Deltaproteobacteria bacterium]